MPRPPGTLTERIAKHFKISRRGIKHHFDASATVHLFFKLFRLRLRTKPSYANTIQVAIIRQEDTLRYAYPNLFQAIRAMHRIIWLQEL